MSKEEYWIKEALEGRRGKYRESVARRYGKRGFTRRGTIRREVIARDVESPYPSVQKKAVLARTLKRVRKT